MNPLESVQAELAAALGERAEIDKKIQALQQSAKVLEPIYGRRPTMGGLHRLATGEIKNLGITAAVERILILNAGTALSPTRVRDELRDAGFELVGDNPLASIHQVLKRLVARNASFVAEEFQGQTLYKYDLSRVPAMRSVAEIIGEFQKEAK